MSESDSVCTSLRDKPDAYFSNCNIQNDEANRQEPPYLRGHIDDPLLGSRQYIFDNVYNTQRELKMMKRQAEIERLENSMREQKLEENNASMPSIREPSPGIQNHEEPEKTPQEELSDFGNEATAPQRPESPYLTCDFDYGPSAPWTPGYVPELNDCCRAG